MKNFMYFSKGVAALMIAVLCLKGIIFFHISVPAYEGDWRGLFGEIIIALGGVNNATESLAQELPKGVQKMRQMNATMEAMSYTMNDMQRSVTHLSTSVDKLSVEVPYYMFEMNNKLYIMTGQVGYMTRDMHGMKNKFSPGGMMRSMMP